MAFLNRKSLSRLADEANVKPHSLFETCDPSADVRMAYLQGCVLAVLINDEEISKSDNRNLNNLGASLKLSQDDIDSCMKSVEALSSDQEKENLVSECLALLKFDEVPHYFMQDFQSFLDFSSNSELEAYMDDFGTILFGDRDWKSIDKSLQENIPKKKSERDTQLFLSDMNEQLSSLESKEVLDKKDIDRLSTHIHSQSYKTIGTRAVKNEILEVTETERQAWRRMLFLGLFLGKITEDQALLNLGKPLAPFGASECITSKDRKESQTMDRQREIELLKEWGF